jgi:hypothetical protein
VAPGATLSIGLIRRGHEPSELAPQFVDLAHATMGDPRRRTLACASAGPIARLPVE